MLYRASIDLCLDDEKLVRAIEKSMVAESKSPANVGKTRIVVEGIERGCLRLSIECDTLTHLRALINSVLYLVNASIKVVDMLSKELIGS